MNELYLWFAWCLLTEEEQREIIAKVVQRAADLIDTINKGGNNGTN